jgi:hypothetical protein
MQGEEIKQGRKTKKQLSPQLSPERKIQGPS